jgi:hypothetical protein
MKALKQQCTFHCCQDVFSFPTKTVGVDMGVVHCRSLVLAIELLKVKMVIVMHHTDCGAQVIHWTMCSQGRPSIL